MPSPKQDNVSVILNNQNDLNTRKSKNIEKSISCPNLDTNSNIYIVKTDSCNLLIGIIFLINLSALIGMFVYFSNGLKEERDLTNRKIELVLEAVAKK